MASMMIRRISPATGLTVLLVAVASLAPAASKVALAQPARAQRHYHRPVRPVPPPSVHHHHRTVVVAPVGMQTIATFIWRQFEQGSVGLGMAMAFVTIFLTTLLPLLFLSLLRRSSLIRE